MHLSVKAPHGTGRRLMISLVILALLLNIGLPGVSAATGAGSQPEDQVQQAVPSFRPVSCATFEPTAGLVEGQDVECGFVTVPEQHDQPNGPTIELGVVILKSLNPDAPPDPILILQGGPGGSTIETYTFLSVTNPALRQNRDIILFDQRGTSHSNPSLYCQEVFDLSVELLDDDLTQEESNRLTMEALRECRDRLENEGVNLDAYNTLENAADVDAVRRALGYEQVNLYGVSYGTLLALNVMRDYPEGLRSVTLDSVVPPQVNFILNTAQTQNRSFEMLFDACASDPECSAAYPNLREVFYEQVDRLNEDPVFITVTDTKTGESYRALVDGDSLVAAVFQMLYATEIIPLLPRVIYEVRAGNYSFLERILSLLVFDQSISVGMYYSVMCSEDADFTPDEFDLSNLPPQILSMEEDTPETFLQTCDLIGVKELGPQMDEPVESDVPTLILSGNFDPITPPEYAQQAAETLRNNYFFVFPFAGHGVLGSVDCADQIFIDFLNNPQQEPDSTCLAENVVAFSTPGALVRLPKLYPMLNLEGTTWVELGLYFLALLFLLTALVVYPVVWIVRLLTRKPAPPAYPLQGNFEQVNTPGVYDMPEAYGAPAYPQAQPAPVRERPRGLYRLAPWASALVGILLLVFTVILIGILVQMITANDLRMLMGLPGTARPLFILPLLSALLALGMIVIAVTAWARGAGSVWGRLYFSLLTLAALACVAVLTYWGMTTAVFTA